MSRRCLLLLSLLALCSGNELVCGQVQCSNLQTCCADTPDSCCVKNSITGLVVILGVIGAAALTATSVGICLYFKKRVHHDTTYTVEDIEGLYAKSVLKEVRERRVSEQQSNCEPQIISEIDYPYERVPMVQAGSQRSDYATLPGYTMAGVPQHFGAQGQQLPPVIASNLASRQPSVNTIGGQTTSFTTLNSSEQVLSTTQTEDKMTESASTQVTSAKRTVVTVNLNMKEKENIKLNIFMNKDKPDVEEGTEASFPRGLTAKRRAGKRTSSARNRNKSAEEKEERTGESDDERREKSAERKKSVERKKSLERKKSVERGRSKSPVKKKGSSKESAKKKTSVKKKMSRPK